MKNGGDICHLGIEIGSFKVSGTDQPKEDVVFLLKVCEKDTIFVGRYMKKLPFQ